MYKLNINQDACIGCGLCVKVCPAYHLEINNGKSQEIDSLCIQCGQCHSICPKHAISLPQLEGRPSIPTKDLTNNKINPETLKNFYLSRRSIRFFTDQDISKETFCELIQGACGNDPSYYNIQTTEFAVVDERFNDFKKHLHWVLRDELDKHEIIDLHGDPVDRNDFVRFFDMYMNGKFPHDPFFHNGRQAIAVFAKHPADAYLGMAHIESMAYAMGLGGFWLGYAITASEKKPEEMMSFFPEIDQSKRMYAFFVLGYPDIKYQRTSPKPAIPITFM